MNKARFLGFALILGWAVLSLGCNGNNGDFNFSGNAAKSTLNVTGNYAVFASPNAAIKNITMTQTANRIRAVDNLGTVYTGSSTGDIGTTTVITSSSTQMIVTAITMEGTDRSGTVITITLTSATVIVGVPPKITGETDLVVTALPPLETNAVNVLAVKGLLGTYVDSISRSGSFEMVNNA